MNTFWMGLARRTLHVPPQTPIVALQGNLGWWPFSIRAVTQMAGLWERATCMDDSEPLRNAMVVQRRLVLNRQPCWLANFKTVLHTLGDEAVRVWNAWFGVFGPVVKPSTFDTRRMFDVKVGRFSTVIHLHRCIIVENCSEAEKRNWEAEEGRVCARSRSSAVVGGGNKLRTYARFKSEVEFEPYLDCVEDVRKRVLLTKFRAGVAPLRLETGRYEVNPATKKVGLPVGLRICVGCGAAVEDEVHLLLRCTCYWKERHELFRAVNRAGQGTPGLAALVAVMNSGVVSDALFVELMRSKHPEVVRAVASFVWKAFKCRDEFRNGTMV